MPWIACSKQTNLTIFIVNWVENLIKWGTYLIFEYMRLQRQRFRANAEMRSWVEEKKIWPFC